MAALPRDMRDAFPRQIAALLDAEDVAKDIAAHRSSPPGLRIWTGATVEKSDLEALTPWLDWGFAEAKQALAQGRVTGFVSGVGSHRPIARAL